MFCCIAKSAINHYLDTHHSTTTCPCQRGPRKILVSWLVTLTIHHMISTTAIVHMSLRSSNQYIYHKPPGCFSFVCPPRSRRVFWNSGILTMLAATFVLSTGVLCVKLVGKGLPPLQVLLTRSCFSAIVTLQVLSRGPKGMAISRGLRCWVSSLVLWCCMWCSYVEMATWSVVWGCAPARCHNFSPDTN